MKRFIGRRGKSTPVVFLDETLECRSLTIAETSELQDRFADLGRLTDHIRLQKQLPDMIAERQQELDDPEAEAERQAQLVEYSERLTAIEVDLPEVRKRVQAIVDDMATGTTVEDLEDAGSTGITWLLLATGYPEERAEFTLQVLRDLDQNAVTDLFNDTMKAMGMEIAAGGEPLDPN